MSAKVHRHLRHKLEASVPFSKTPIKGVSARKSKASYTSTKDLSESPSSSSSGEPKNEFETKKKKPVPKKRIRGSEEFQKLVSSSPECFNVIKVKKQRTRRKSTLNFLPKIGQTAEDICNNMEPLVRNRGRKKIQKRADSGESELSNKENTEDTTSTSSDSSDNKKRGRPRKAKGKSNNILKKIPKSECERVTIDSDSDVEFKARLDNVRKSKTEAGTLQYINKRPRSSSEENDICKEEQVLLKETLSQDQCRTSDRKSVKSASKKSFTKQKSRIENVKNRLLTPDQTGTTSGGGEFEFDAQELNATNIFEINLTLVRPSSIGRPASYSRKTKSVKQSKSNCTDNRNIEDVSMKLSSHFTNNTTLSGVASKTKQGADFNISGLLAIPKISGNDNSETDSQSEHELKREDTFEIVPKKSLDTQKDKENNDLPTGQRSTPEIVPQLLHNQETTNRDFINTPGYSEKSRGVIPKSSLRKSRKAERSVSFSTNHRYNMSFEDKNLEITAKKLSGAKQSVSKSPSESSKSDTFEISPSKSFLVNSQINKDAEAVNLRKTPYKSCLLSNVSTAFSPDTLNRRSQRKRWTKPDAIELYDLSNKGLKIRRSKSAENCDSIALIEIPNTPEKVKSLNDSDVIYVRSYHMSSFKPASLGKMSLSDFSVNKVKKDKPAQKMLSRSSTFKQDNEDSTLENDVFTESSVLRAMNNLDQRGGLQATPFARRTNPLPSFTSTPLQDRKVITRNKVVQDKENKSGKKSSSRTKIPNFALIHQRAFNKMENIKELNERKAIRAKMLLSGSKPVLGTSLGTNCLQKRNNKQLKFSPSAKDVNISKSPKRQQPTTAIPSVKVKAILKTALPHAPFSFTTFPKASSHLNKKNSLDKKKELTKVKSPRNKNKLEKVGFTRFGFKERSGIDISKKDMIKAVATKSKPTVNNTKAEIRNEIKGVRSNRRFELLMNMRNKNKK